MNQLILIGITAVILIATIVYIHLPKRDHCHNDIVEAK